MSRGRPRTRKNIWRTKIEVDEETLKLLRSLKTSTESYNDLLKNILRGDIFVYFDFISIDNDEPNKHIVIFRVGDFYYRFENGKFLSLGPNDIPKILRRKEVWQEH